MMAPKRKVISAVTSKANSLGFGKPSAPIPAVTPPARLHGPEYHYPLLLEDGGASDRLLSWFASVEETRQMPWRAKWIDPEEYIGKEEELGKVLARRAYEVWVSEVMLQQTRVSTVIPYFKNWISNWPTIEDLAAAQHDDVLKAWKGLGYYSRATRLHEGAKEIIARPDSQNCKIPNTVEGLLKLPGIGRYTAGAISSIAFGEAEPVLDGNVARVLSRQLGLYVDAKDKNVSDVLWAEADRLIKHVSGFPETQTSEIPGQWNQALMELGSTICAPRPRCGECPIQTTCRTYQEGGILSAKRQSSTAVPDIEDACKMCETLDTEDLALTPEDADGEDATPPPTKKRKAAPKQSNTLSNYFVRATRANSSELTPVEEDGSSKKRKSPLPESPSVPLSTVKYCSLFPKKVAKKEAKAEECVVCVVELRLSNRDETKSKWLIEQRPAKGLLASLWQFPQRTLVNPLSKHHELKEFAKEHLATLNAGDMDLSKALHVKSFPSMVHIFTHIALTMHTLHFSVTVDSFDDVDLSCAGPPARKWVDTRSMEGETLSTGMRKCWELVQKPRV